MACEALPVSSVPSAATAVPHLSPALFPCVPVEVSLKGTSGNEEGQSTEVFGSQSLLSTKLWLGTALCLPAF